MLAASSCLLLYQDVEAEVGKPQKGHPPLGVEPWCEALGTPGQETLLVFKYSVGTLDFPVRTFSSGDSSPGFPCSFSVCPVLESPQFSGPCPLSAEPPQLVVPKWETIGCRIQLTDFLLTPT